MIVVGLTGGLATGKSTVARLFQAHGAIVIDADVLARQVVEPGTLGWREIVRVFGTNVLRPDRTLDRPALAMVVFRDRAKLRALETIIHPRVAREQARLTREIARKDPHAVIIYDAPVLIEAGAHRRMGKLIVVTAPQKVQLARLAHRNRLPRAEALRRVRAQMSLKEKAKLADYVIDGSAPMEEVRRTVARIWRELLALA